MAPAVGKAFAADIAVFLMWVAEFTLAVRRMPGGVM
jgi:hypothetical protein